MYEPFFELRKRPFPSVPCVDHYYPATAVETARTTLVRCVRRAEGPALLVGPSGMGKTMVCRVLAKELDDQFRVVFLASGRLGSRRALLQAMLYELGQPYRGLDEGEARLALADYITLSDECLGGLLLIIDEAHTLPLRLLDEVRMTTNLTYEGKPWVRVVLAGGCMLEERFASPKLDSFSQRIAARCYLESLGAVETQQYIWAQVGHAGGRGESLFPEPACQAAYRASGGVPRLINQVCDHALLLACAAGKRQLEPGNIEEAWADLQQLPTPWNGDSAPSGSDEDVIEFGQLDDEPDSFDDEPEEAPDTIPVLRISAEPDDAVPNEPDIGRQVEKIEEMLDQVDSDEVEFAPAGSIGPEIELRFDKPHDPFAEDFAEEEIVDDAPREPVRKSPPEPTGASLGAGQPARPAPNAEPNSNAASTDDRCDWDHAISQPETRGLKSDAEVSRTDDLASQISASVYTLTADASPEAASAVELDEDTPQEDDTNHRPELSVTGGVQQESTESDSASDFSPVGAEPARPAPAHPQPKYSRLFATLRQA